MGLGVMHLPFTSLPPLPAFAPILPFPLAPPWLDPHLFGVALAPCPPPPSPVLPFPFSCLPTSLPILPFELQVRFLGLYTNSPISADLMIKPSTLHLILLPAAQMQNDTRFWRLVSTSPPPSQSSAPVFVPPMQVEGSHSAQPCA